jgi:hypothetical protein
MPCAECWKHYKLGWGGGGPALTMTMEPLNFQNGHCQNDHLAQDYDTIYHQIDMVKWSKLTDISTTSTNFNNFHQKLSGIVEMVMIKFGLTIFCGIKFCQFFQIYVETLE